MSSTLDVGTAPGGSPGETPRAAPDPEGPARPGGPRRRDLGRTVARGAGQTLITLGLVALLFVAYQMWVTSFFTAQEQHRLVAQIHDRWQDRPTVTAGQDQASPAGAQPSPAGEAGPAAPSRIQVRLGQPFAILHIPRMGGAWAVVEGVAQTQLAKGPGHYRGTALPGEQGNFAVAGHRIDSVFMDLDTLRPGDAIVVETGDYWFVYRVLGDPATGSFTGDPSGIPGQETVLPTGVDVISPTPDGPPGGPATGAYLTLTTCTPAISATHRLIVHARLDGPPLPKAEAPDGPPALHG